MPTVDVDLIRSELTSKNTAFFHIDNKLDFYLGNTGSPLRHLGNIKDLSSDEIYHCIITAEDNYYETKTIHYEDLLAAVRNDELMLSKENYVYPNVIAAVLAMVCNGRKK